MDSEWFRKYSFFKKLLGKICWKNIVQTKEYRERNLIILKCTQNNLVCCLHCVMYRSALFVIKQTRGG